MNPEVEQPDLFRYPYVPGAQNQRTSHAAADDMAPKASTYRGMCLAILKKAAHTPDEVAGILDVSVLTIRPRITELKLMGFIEDSGEVRQNASGKMAIVWKATNKHTA